MSENLMGDELDKETRESCVRSIHESADHLNWLIHTLLAIAQMDAGALVFRRENVSLAELLASVLQDLSVYAELNGTVLKMNVPDCIDHYRFQMDERGTEQHHSQCNRAYARRNSPDQGKPVCGCRGSGYL